MITKYQPYLIVKINQPQSLKSSLEHHRFLQMSAALSLDVVQSSGYHLLLALKQMDSLVMACFSCSYPCSCDVAIKKINVENKKKSLIP